MLHFGFDRVLVHCAIISNFELSRSSMRIMNQEFFEDRRIYMGKKERHAGITWVMQDECA